MNCNNYDTCKQEKKSTLRRAADDMSLYGRRIYDNQTANRRCYETNPINIVEGFGLSFNTLFKWVVIILVIYLVGTIIVQLFDTKEEVSIKLETPASESTLPLPTVMKENL